MIGDVRKQLTAAVARRDKKQPVRDSRESLGSFLAGWLERRKSSGKPLAPRTFEGYSGYVNNHLIPGLGRVALDELTPSDVDAFLSRKLAAGFKPQSVRHMRGILQRALKTAVRDQLIPRNVATLSDPVSVPNIEVRPLDLDEARQFLAAARGHRLEVLFLTGRRAPSIRSARYRPTHVAGDPEIFPFDLIGLDRLSSGLRPRRRAVTVGA